MVIEIHIRLQKVFKRNLHNHFTARQSVVQVSTSSAVQDVQMVPVNQKWCNVQYGC